MRYWLTSLAVVLFVVAVGDTQEAKKKDTVPGKDPKVEPAKEPTEVMGKSFDEWRKALKSPDPGDRETAMKTVLLFGMARANDAMPDIIKELKKHTFNKPVDLSVRVNGTMAMNTYFLHMKNAKKDPDEKLLEEAIGVYKVSLKDSQVVLKLRAVQGLPYLGPPARKMLDEVVTLSRDPATWELRKEAIPVLVMLAPDSKGVPDPKAMAALRKSAGVATGVEETSHLVRLVAVQGLGMLGGKDNIVDLKRVLLNDKSKEVRVMAVQALASAGKESVLVELRRAINEDPAKEVKLTAVQAYAAAGKEKSLPEMRNLLDHPDKDMRLQTLNMVAALKDVIVGGEKTAMLKRLNERLGFEKDPILRIWTHAAIMTINDINQAHMAPVVQQISDKDEKVRMAAFQAISMGGVKSKPFALNPVLAAVQDKDLSIAIAAIETLMHIQAKEAIPALQAIMKDAKAPDELKEAAENALDGFDLLALKERNEKEKKSPEKK